MWLGWWPASISQCVPFPALICPHRSSLIIWRGVPHPHYGQPNCADCCFHVKSCPSVCPAWFQTFICNSAIPTYPRPYQESLCTGQLLHSFHHWHSAWHLGRCWILSVTLAFPECPSWEMEERCVLCCDHRDRREMCVSMFFLHFILLIFIQLPRDQHSHLRPFEKEANTADDRQC